MNNDIKVVILYDIYGNLLTDKQRKIFEEYYLYNLSLREIAANRNISYQAVSDSIKKSENMLYDFEEKIKMKKYKDKIKSVYKLVESAEDLNLLKDEILKKLSYDVSEDDI